MDSILATLQLGLPVLVGQFAATLALLAIGMACYMALTPFHEWRLVQQGNVAAGVVVAGTLVALALPLAATLAASVLCSTSCFGGWWRWSSSSRRSSSRPRCCAICAR